MQNSRPLCLLSCFLHILYFFFNKIVTLYPKPDTFYPLSLILPLHRLSTRRVPSPHGKRILCPPCDSPSGNRHLFLESGAPHREQNPYLRNQGPLTGNRTPVFGIRNPLRGTESLPSESGAPHGEQDPVFENRSPHGERTPCFQPQGTCFLE